MLMLAKDAGGLQALASKTGTDAKYLSQVKNRWKRPGSDTVSAMGDDVARRIERALNKSNGWMDVLHKGADGAAHGAATLSAREEMMLTLFRGLTPEQQRELTLSTLAQVDANREVQERFLDRPLRTFSNEQVERAYGKVPSPKQAAKRPAKRRGAGQAEEDPE